MQGLSKWDYHQVDKRTRYQMNIRNRAAKLQRGSDIPVQVWSSVLSALQHLLQKPHDLSVRIVVGDSSNITHTYHVMFALYLPC